MIRHIFFTINCKFDFGKYKGLSLEEVLSFDSQYLDWCIAKYKTVYYSYTTIQEIRMYFPEYIIPAQIIDRSLDDGPMEVESGLF